MNRWWHRFALRHPQKSWWVTSPSEPETKSMIICECGERWGK